MGTWKEKILDYEIETQNDLRFKRFAQLSLEKKRFSITRLKQFVVYTDSMPTNTAWKEKILDYEIETEFPFPALQRWLATWKEKILDYEIETVWIGIPTLTKPQATWKEKILDYEIETTR